MTLCSAYPLITLGRWTALPLLLFMTAGFSSAQHPGIEPAGKLAAGKPQADMQVTAHALTAPDLEAFLDGVVPLQIKRDDIAGAVIAVVKNGTILLAKGYGYADVDNKKPISADAITL
jgi:CubicO group peptidase (beta-lactamase class C family)